MNTTEPWVVIDHTKLSPDKFFSDKEEAMAWLKHMMEWYPTTRCSLHPNLDYVIPHEEAKEPFIGQIILDGKVIEEQPYSFRRLFQEGQHFIRDSVTYTVTSCQLHGTIVKTYVKIYPQAWKAVRKVPFSIKPFFAWYDVWIGGYWDKKGRRLFICPLPTCGVIIQFPYVVKEDEN